MKRMACVLALATGTGLAVGAATQPALAEPAPATAATGLKINLVPPASATNDVPVALDVRFRGGSIRTIEVFVDNQRLTKQSLKTATSGVVHLELDDLTEGSHEIRVEATDPDGNTATSTMILRVLPGDAASPTHFLTPRRNAEVKDVVPLQIQVDSAIKNPYVSFFVDNEFLALKNYAPYEYNWDSNKVANGKHTLSIEVYDGETLAKVKTLNMPVTVKNPGGWTNRQPTTPSINDKNPHTGVPGALSASMAEPSSLSIEMPQLSRTDGAAKRSLGMRLGAAPRNSYPVHMPAVLDPNVPNLGFNPRSADFVRPASQLAHTSFRSPIAPGARLAAPSNIRPNGPAPQPLGTVLPGVAGVLSNPQDLVTLALSTPNHLLARNMVHPRRAGNIAARPRTDLNGPEVEPRAPTVVKSMVAPAFLPGRYHHARTFDVAFDNTRIAFDVPPRIEHGLPMAPFRAIFEHTGGVVQWFGQSKTVRAINSDNEIEIKIGQKDARVNNQKVTMESSPYIDQGRTIVPLSFVRDAMNVKVQYDVKTGHLLIESKK